MWRLPIQTLPRFTTRPWEFHAPIPLRPLLFSLHQKICGLSKWHWHLLHCQKNLPQTTNKHPLLIILFHPQKNMPSLQMSTGESRHISPAIGVRAWTSWIQTRTAFVQDRSQAIGIRLGSAGRSQLGQSAKVLWWSAVGEGAQGGRIRRAVSGQTIGIPVTQAGPRTRLLQACRATESQLVRWLCGSKEWDCLGHWWVVVGDDIAVSILIYVHLQDSSRMPLLGANALAVVTTCLPANCLWLRQRPGITYGIRAVLYAPPVTSYLLTWLTAFSMTRSSVKDITQRCWSPVVTPVMR